MANQRFFQRFKPRLELREQQGLIRQQQVFHSFETETSNDSPSAGINFSSNDYLGLANEPQVIEAWQDGLSKYGAGSKASPLVTGFTSPHQQLCDDLCDWLGFEKALLFNSGFSANQAVLFTLLEKNDLLIQDRLNHASLMESGLHSPATFRRFLHNDVGRLDAILAQSINHRCRLVVTEGVFSMDGDLSPLKDIELVTKQRQALLMVDDAHGIGVLGEEGRGSCDLASIKPDILIVTFGKAFGLMGAAVLCHELTYQYLLQFSKHYTYSTAMPPAQAHALSASLKLIRSESWRREKLEELSVFFHQQLSDFPQVVKTKTPIKPLILGESQITLDISQQLQSLGFFVCAIRPPTVPKNTARLRVTLSARHTHSQILQLTSSLQGLLRHLNT